MERTMWWSIPVPAPLITDKRLSRTSRSLYMTLRSLCETPPYGQDPANPNSCRLTADEIKRLGGVRSHVTAAKHLRALAAAGWIDIKHKFGPGPTEYRLTDVAEDVPIIRVPAYIATLPTISPVGRWLYAYILMRCGRPNVPIHFQQEQLASATGFSCRSAIRTTVTTLCEAGWLTTSRTVTGTAYTPLDPHRAARLAELSRVKRRLRRAEFLGEALAKEWLTLLVSDERYVDGVRLKILTNPGSDERMEFDRHYEPAKVAVEFHGIQHFQATGRFTEQEVREQRVRDLVKLQLARENGITVIVLQAEHLTQAGIQTAVEGILPLRLVRSEDPVLRYLHRRAQSYRTFNHVTAPATDPVTAPATAPATASDSPETH